MHYSTKQQLFWSPQAIHPPLVIRDNPLLNGINSSFIQGSLPEVVEFHVWQFGEGSSALVTSGNHLLQAFGVSGTGDLIEFGHDVSGEGDLCDVEILLEVRDRTGAGDQQDVD